MKQLMLEEKEKKNTQEEVQWMRFFRGTRGVQVKDLTVALTFSKGDTGKRVRKEERSK